jgi:3-methylfumaryl-CoA hydratase
MELIRSDVAAALAGLLDREGEPLRDGELLPAMWQIVYFLARPAQRDLGPDGHPTTGFPTSPHPGMRRMFAGGRLYLTPGLTIGSVVDLSSEVLATRDKEGSSGPMTLMTTRSEARCEERVVLAEERDVVYLPGRPAGSPSAVTRSPAPSESHHTEMGDVVQHHKIDSTLLFRFSALTYNAHRIHYDRDYARQVEGYPGLVVHGPLQALLMAELGRELLGSPTGLTMTYRLTAPLFEGQGLAVRGRTVDSVAHVQITDAEGRQTATATVNMAADDGWVS